MDDDDILATIGGPALLSIPDALRFLGDIGRSNFYEEVGDGEIELVKIGSRSFAPVTSLREVRTQAAIDANHWRLGRGR